MKHIIMSIQPQHVANILNGKKTVEIRKTAPKPPFTVWVYCTKAKPIIISHPYECKWVEWEKVKFDDDIYGVFNLNQLPKANGQIVAKFVVENVEEIAIHRVDNSVDDYDLYLGTQTMNTDELCNLACVSHNQMEEYLPNAKGLALHIKDLVILDKPLALGDFIFDAKVWNPAYHAFEEVPRPLYRAPQSWQYVAPKEL